MSQFNDQRPGPTPAGTSRPNTHPHHVTHTHRTSQSYRVRPTADLSGDPVRNGDAAARATALVRKKTRQRRIRNTLGVLGALVVLVGVGLWLWLSQTLGTVLDAGIKVFVTPAARGVDENGTPKAVIYPDWGKKEPVNILLIGLDLRDQQQDTRADTQIVIHIDPVAKTAAMFAIPRDLWVPIPGHGEARINAAYQLGEKDKMNVPGGGPALAMSTIEENFGITIHYFAQVDFTGFERVVDAMGGVMIDVPRPLVDNEYPLANEGITRIYIPAGLQHMDGRTALQYARSRHADSDLGRNYRQQQVLLALRQQGLNLNLITKLNELAGKLSDAVKTDLPAIELGSLAQLGKQIGPESIQTVLIDADMVHEVVLPGTGAQVLMPRWELIRPKLAQAFSDPRLANEDARISVKNGTNTSGIGRKVYDLLLAKGFFVPDLSAATDQGKYPTTKIIDYSGGKKPRTVEALAKALGINLADVEQGNKIEAPLANSDQKPVDIVVVAGDDKIAR